MPPFARDSAPMPRPKPRKVKPIKKAPFQVPGSDYTDTGLYDQKPSMTFQQLMALFGSDPFAKPDPYDRPLTPQQQRREASQFVGAQTTPLLREIENAIERRSRRGSEAIRGYTGAHTKLLEGFAPNVDAAYGQARSEIGSQDAALAAYLKDMGAKDAAELQGKLGSAGMTGAAVSEAGSTADLGARAGGSLAASGNATLDQLSAAGAAEHSFAAGLPRIAALEGQRDLTEFQRDLTDTLADETGAVRASVPGLSAQIAQMLSGRESDKAGRRFAGKQESGNRRQTGAAAFLAMLTGTENSNLQRALARQGLNSAAMDRELQHLQLKVQQADSEADRAQATREYDLKVKEYNSLYGSGGKYDQDRASSETTAAAQNRTTLQGYFLQNGYLPQGYTRKGGFVLDPKGNVVGTVDSITKPTPSNTNTAVKDARGAADQIIKSMTRGGVKGVTGATSPKVKPTWGEANRELREQLTPSLRRGGASPAEIDSIINSALRRAGIVKKTKQPNKPGVPPVQTGPNSTFPGG